MKKILILAVIASSTVGLVAATSQANAGKGGDYAKEYCEYYKTKAMWTNDQNWWDAYYACIRDNR